MKVVIADDHPLFRSALSQAVNQCLDSPELLAVGSFDELSAMLERERGAICCCWI